MMLPISVVTFTTLLLVATALSVGAFAPSESTSRRLLASANTMATRDPEAQDDGLAGPTDEEWSKLHDMASNVHYAAKPITSLGHHVLVAPASIAGDTLNGVLGRRESPNVLLFDILKRIREGTDTYACNLKPVDFSNNIHNTLFYQTKAQFLSDATVATLYPVLKLAPALQAEEGEINYAELMQGKVQPYQAMMISKDPEDCFLKNAPAFCSPEKGGSGRSVCDLDYLTEYNVDMNTPKGLRYGGRAIVKGGKIVEISGVTPEADKDLFEKKKWIFLSSFAVHLVVSKHAVMAHLAIYQRLLIKLTTNRTETYINGWTSHTGPRRFLEGLLTRSNTVSINEQLLIGPGNSLVGRTTSFTNKSLLKLGSDYYDKYKDMKPYDVVLSNAKEGSARWESACIRVFDAAKEAVKSICRDLIDDETLTDDDVEELSLLVWTSTFYHYFIGDFQLDNVNKGNLPFTLTGEKHDQTLAYGTLATTIGVSTMTRTVDMKTLSSYFHAETHSEAWLEYEKVLNGVKLGIPEYDAAEPPIYNSINF